MDRPQIIHYTTNAKPWFYQFDVRYEDQYYKYLALTPWRGFAPPDRNAKAIIKRHSKRFVKYFLSKYTPQLFSTLKGWRRSIMEARTAKAS